MEREREEEKPNERGRSRADEEVEVVPARNPPSKGVIHRFVSPCSRPEVAASLEK